jgi:hypothetical protein
MSDLFFCSFALFIRAVPYKERTTLMRTVKNASGSEAIQRLLASFLLSTALGVSSSLALPAQAQTDAELQQQVVRKKAEAELAKANADIATAKRAEADAQLSDASKPLKGETTLGQGAGTMESTGLAVDAMYKIAEYIHTSILNSVDKNTKSADKNTGFNIFIYNDASIQALSTYRSYSVSLSHLVQAYQTALGLQSNVKEYKTEFQSLDILPTVTSVRSAVELLALFRQDTKIEKIDLKFDKRTFFAQIGSLFSEKNIKVYYPDGVLLDRNVYAWLWNNLDALFSLKEAADAKLSTEKAKSVCKSKKPQKPQNCQDAELIQSLTDINSKFDEFVKSLKDNNIYSIALGKKLDDLLIPKIKIQADAANIVSFQKPSEKCYLLIANIEQAGGSSRTRNNLFTTLFSSEQVNYNGGVVVSYFLFDPDGGQVLASGTYYNNTGFQDVTGRTNNLK